MITGKAWVYGNDVNTDYILPGRYMELTDPREMARHAMEGIDPTFLSGVNQGDVVVGGRNFGCGSSREHAPLALRGSGVGCVLAESYARIFYRNAINIGLPALECPGITNAVKAGDQLDVDLRGGSVLDRTNGKQLSFTPLPPFMLEVLNAGGLVPYLKGRDEW